MDNEDISGEIERAANEARLFAKNRAGDIRDQLEVLENKQYEINKSVRACKVNSEPWNVLRAHQKALQIEYDNLLGELALLGDVDDSEEDRDSKMDNDQ